VKHTVYAGSFAPNGKQSNYGNRAVTEDDPVRRRDQKGVRAVRRVVSLFGIAVESQRRHRQLEV
jgi:hypothetical protein